jgi:N-acetylglucosaminyl-diphospho-decaprenol L-rhamnosyltransferase
LEVVLSADGFALEQNELSRGIAAVIVTHNSAAAVAECLAHLQGPDEIIVVDNASCDHTLEAVRHAAPKATLIANKGNRGFAAAVNQGVDACRSDLILLVNPDVALTAPITVSSPMARRAMKPEIGVVGGRLTGLDGRVQSGFTVRAFPTRLILGLEALGVNRLWPSNYFNRRYRLAQFDYDQPQRCDQPAGALMIFRRSLFQELQGFDEDFYPVWFEDVDFCLRASNAGYLNWYEPTASAVHEGAHSVSRLPLPERQKYWYGSLLRFAKKHFDPYSVACLQASIAIGLALRGIALSWSARSRTERQAYFQAMRMILTGSIANSPSEQSEKGKKQTFIA